MVDLKFDIMFPWWFLDFVLDPVRGVLIFFFDLVSGVLICSISYVLALPAWIVG